MIDGSARRRLVVLLDELETAAAENVRRSALIQQRLHEIRGALDMGVSTRAAVATESEPRAVELISMNMAALEDVGSKYRAGLALALREDGATLEAIGELFGVSRQRISALLRQKAADVGDAPGS